jgi:hypothetical protein
MQAPEKRKVHNYLYNGANAKKIEESNEKKRKRILLAQSMQQGMVDNEDDATLSSVGHTEDGFLAAADVDVDVDVNTDEESAEIEDWQDVKTRKTRKFSTISRKNSKEGKSE